MATHVKIFDSWLKHAMRGTRERAEREERESGCGPGSHSLRLISRKHPWASPKTLSPAPSARSLLSGLRPAFSNGRWLAAIETCGLTLTTSTATEGEGPEARAVGVEDAAGGEWLEEQSSLILYGESLVGQANGNYNGANYGKHWSLSRNWFKFYRVFKILLFDRKYSSILVLNFLNIHLLSNKKNYLSIHKRWYDCSWIVSYSNLLN